MRPWFLFLVFIFSACSSAGDSKTNKLKALDAKIAEVTEEITKLELKAMKGELDSQGFFRDDYAKFASKLAQGEKEEIKAEELKKQLKTLNQQKSTLLKEK